MDEWTLNDLLECSVCLERLDTSSKVLPCQHTFCKKCLEEIVSTHKELRCPECRILVDVKIEDLPPNVLLMRILEGMRNAAPKKRNAAPNRLQGGHFLPPTNSVQQVASLQQQQPPQQHQVSSHAATIATSDTRVHSAPKHHVMQPSQPYARAIYDYLSSEPGDLCFKKGDIILLRKKIDNNWYHGESGGNHGVFPLTYVQVITPLPSHVPQCKALYDFRMTNDDEEGCLTFNKGEVITVIRRVDENWAEGKLGDRIGIFPLAFVELNSVARALMKLSTNSQPGPSRVAPPTPTSEDTTPLIPTDHTRTVANSHSSQQHQGVATNLGNVSGSSPTVISSSQPAHHHQMSNTNLTMGNSSNILLPVGTSDSSSTVSSASSTTTPNTSSSNTSSSSSTAPSSPTSPPPPRVPVPGLTPPPHNMVAPPPPRPAHNPNTSPPHVLPPHHGTPAHHAPSTQHREKRHSFSVLHTGHHHQASHRHSAEILSPTETMQDSHTPEQSSQSQIGGSNELIQRQGSQRHRRSGSSDTTVSTVASGLTPPPPQGAPHHSPATQLPAAYIALYPYKPHKADELELKKGAIYMVTERCQDGWFKGTSSRTQKCGVFPGNYVAPARSLTSGQTQLRLTRNSNSPSTSPQQGTIASSGGSSGSPRSNPAASTPPLEPRSFTRSGSSNKQGSSPLMYSPRNSQQSHNILVTSMVTSQIPPELPPRSSSPGHSSPSISLSQHHISTSASSSTHHGSIISSSWHGQQPQQPGTLGSDLTSNSTPIALGRSHSAVMATGNTTTHGFDTTTSTLGRSSGGQGLVHMSTTVTPPPNVSVSAVSSRPLDKTKEKKTKGGLMSRFTSMKKSKSPPPATYSMDNPVFDDGSVAASPQHPVHVRSGSCPSQLLQVLPLDGSTAHHRLFGSSASSGSQRIKHKERPNVVVANLAHFGRSNDNSAASGGGSGNHHRKSNSLDAGTGGEGRKPNKTLVPPVRERFRCIVPYPPNSEVELELWVGDIIYVHKKREDGWYKGTQQRTGRTGLFPASFVEGC